MRLLDRHVLRECASASALATGAFVFVLLAGNVIKMVLGAVSSRQVTPWEACELILLLFPTVLPYALPMGILTGVLLTFGRMGADGEITAMKASGIGLWRIAAPVWAVAAVVALIQSVADTPLTLTADEVKRLRSIDDPIDLDEVRRIYLSLSRLLSSHVESSQLLFEQRNRFLSLSDQAKTPFVIGIAGSVAVGKSTTSVNLAVALAELGAGFTLVDFNRAGDQHLGVHLHLIIRAGRAKNQPGFARLHQHWRIHGVAHALAGRQGIGVAFIQMPIAHAVVEQDAGLCARHAGPEGRIDGLDGGKARHEPAGR